MSGRKILETIFLNWHCQYGIIRDENFTLFVIEADTETLSSNLWNADDALVKLRYVKDLF